MNNLDEENQSLMQENIKLNLEIETYKNDLTMNESKAYSSSDNNEVSYEAYMTAEWTGYLGYCLYVGNNLPRIYPNVDAPRINDNTMWLPNEDEFIVEVIRHTSNDWYLVRIPGCENYVFVTPDELVQIERKDYPNIPELPVSINNISLGDHISKLQSMFEVDTILTGEFASGLVYELYTEKRERGFEVEGMINIDLYNRILGMHLLSNKYLLDSGYTVGDNAEKVLEYYKNQYSEFISMNYKQSDNFFMFDIGSGYFLGFGINTEDINNESTIQVIVVSHQY